MYATRGQPADERPAVSYRAIYDVADSNSDRKSIQQDPEREAEASSSGGPQPPRLTLPSESFRVHVVGQERHTKLALAYLWDDTRRKDRFGASQRGQPGQPGQRRKGRGRQPIFPRRPFPRRQFLSVCVTDGITRVIMGHQRVNPQI